MPNILPYDVRHESELIDVLKQDPDWSEFTGTDTLDLFKNALLLSRTYVCSNEGRICGYLRALVDDFGLYVSELYVEPQSRRIGCGKALLARIKDDHPDQPVYVLSDEDWYYQALGLKRAGSVFRL